MRVVFALFSAILSLLAAACTDGGGPTRRGAPPEGVEPGALEQALVDAHNAARARAAETLPDVSWDSGLATVAQGWAEGCVFEHSSDNDYGENLALFSPRDVDAALATEVVELWESEVADYNYADNRCAAGRVCGHYTQVVWRDTTRIGCGVAACDDVDGFGPGTLWVCNYDPPGNFVGERPY